MKARNLIPVILVCIGLVTALISCKSSMGIRQLVEEEWRDTVRNTKYDFLIKGEFIENDTLFFTQEFLKDYPTEDGRPLRNTAIFLEPSKNSHYYTQEYWIEHLNEESCAKDWIYWQEWRMEKGLPALCKVEIFGLPKDWIPLHFYKGRPCAYVPCEIDYPLQRQLTDSLIASRWYDTFFTPLKSSKKQSASLYHFEIEDYRTLKTADLYIHIIDKKTKTAVWEYRYPDKEEYILMIPIESVSSFDLIVCSAPYQKYFGNQQELFDKVDVKALLEEAKGGKRTTLFNN